TGGAAPRGHRQTHVPGAQQLAPTAEEVGQKRCSAHRSSVRRSDRRIQGGPHPGWTRPGPRCRADRGWLPWHTHSERTVPPSPRLVHHYLDSGGTLIDTADFYAAGGNEMLIARALDRREREEVVLSVKFGALLTPGGMPAGSDGRPVAVKNSLTYSLQRLRTDHVDIDRPARLDPQVPIEETVGAVQELVEAGYVRHIGLSEVGPETIRRAAAVAPISDLQIEYSLLTRDIEGNQILQTCRELGIGITAYG